MARLELKLLKQSLNQPVDNAAVVTIRQVADESGAFPESPFETAMPIPAGPNIEPASVNVPAGRYALTARLPNGVAERRSVSVTGAGLEQIVFDPGRSAHEWLSWQTLTGAVPTVDGYASRGSKTRALRQQVDPSALSRSAPALKGYLANLRLPGLPALSPAPRLQVGAGLISFEGAEVRLEAGPVRHSNSDPTAHAWQIEDSPSPAIPPLAGGPGRAVAVVTASGVMSLAVLPLPWRVANRGSPTRGPALATPEGMAYVDILFDDTAGPERAVRMTIHEPEFVALLSYLGAGRLQEAAASLGGPSLDDHVTRLIADKTENPLAAAGAAYVGLATTGDEAKRAMWSPWLRNLMDMFPELPDGAILFARDRIERCRSSADLHVAKVALKTAYRRGIPHYVVGLQHLLNGLQLFADPEDPSLFDPEARSMRAAVSAVSALADPTQPFTVLTLPEAR